MPIYEYRCCECRHEFELFTRTFEPGEVICPSCQSPKVERIFAPSVRASERLKPTTSEDEEIAYYKDKKDYERAAKAAEKAGKSVDEIIELDWTGRMRRKF